MFKHSTYVVNKRFNLNLENKTNKSYTILFEKERNFLQILLGINSKITKITINPNESYNEELKLSKGEYYISYVYNDILDAYYTKLVIQ
ncbi:MAG: hypothetical protein IJH34_05035 [Romboutsia sp.]|nr:hypothetical protein [Romboutsia sp.]